MRTTSDQQLDTTFAALADPTRRSILKRLSQGDASATELAEPFPISKPAVTKHLKVLERAGLITRTRQAQWRPARLETAPLVAAVRWLESYRTFWEDSFGKLAEHLGTTGRPADPPGRDRGAEL
jgi:DNA-binding transcriptional ArsR family regulator